MKIVILGKPEDKVKMEQMTAIFKQGAGNLNILVNINLTHNFAAFSAFALNPARTPIVFIEGSLEFSGPVPSLDVIEKKLKEFRSQGTQQAF